MIAPPSDVPFHSAEVITRELREICDKCDFARWMKIGMSEGGKSIGGIVLGDGLQTASLVAGNHADEPVGPQTLFWLVKNLIDGDRGDSLLKKYTFIIIPHTNPDGDARNQQWISHWPDFAAYLIGRTREQPGRDLEFGFPDMRPENNAVSTFLREHAPIDLHMSLHGMGLSEGAMLLIDRHWCYRTDHLQAQFALAASDVGLRLHDHNRKGEKGFFYVAPGFWTTPEGTAMRQFFHSQGDDEMAERFHDSSMEFVQSLGGDPLCMVTELPLFVIHKSHDGAPGEPAAYFEVKEQLPAWTARAHQGDHLEDEQNAYQIRPLSLHRAVALQLTAITEGLNRLI